ncbi:HAH_0734 family protein [Haloarcula halophila]|uniref:HAH_0734 family protein n=1 Tax=Haloarcula TaxID=2237 RepID=UPI0023E38BE1|nr:HAH_0734 family protein [Halomicroarcula sp. DFY41]
MKKLIVHGDAGFRKGGRIEYDGEEYEVFAVARQGEWHGPDRPQLWCTVGKAREEETFNKQDYIPMHLDTEDIDAEAITVIREKAPPSAES